MAIDKPIEPIKEYFVFSDAPINLPSDAAFYGMHEYTKEDSFTEHCPAGTSHDHTVHLIAGGSDGKPHEQSAVVTVRDTLCWPESGSD